MQKYLCIGVLTIALWSCSKPGDEDKSIPPDEINVAPTIPELVYPTNNLLCINNTLDFQWDGSNDTNGDVITYRIEVSKDNQFSQISHSEDGASTTQTLVLEKGMAYYWRVKAMDSKKATSKYSSIYSFYTEGEGLTNHLPFAPELVHPVMRGTEQIGVVELKWEAKDIDNDLLRFDVYFDTTNPPKRLISENHDTATFSINTKSATNYYWKIVAKDDKGGQAIGQVWAFSTN